MDPFQLQSRSRIFTIGVLLATIAVTAWLILQDSKAAFTSFVMPGDPGPFFLADISILAIGLAGVILVIQAIVLHRRPWTEGDAGKAGKRIMRCLLPAAFVLTLWGLPAGMAALGTVPAFALFSFGWITALQFRSRRRLIPSLVTAALGAVAVSLFLQLVFIRLLATPLPL